MGRGGNGIIGFLVFIGIIVLLNVLSYVFNCGCSTSPPAAGPHGAGQSCTGWEAAANLAFAVSSGVAAVMRIVSAAPDERLFPEVLGIAAINALIAVLFLLRRPVVALGNPAQLLSCLPTMIGFGLALRFSPPLTAWPWHAHALFTGGAMLTIAAFIALGASFGVLPALRAAVTRGPYRLVRHPAYLGELLMAAACFAAGPSLLAVTAWLLLMPGVVWRINAEELVLGRDEQYANYQQRVRWRLAPGIW
jgi:protein-S-isoprenylcysteine O-methyltransferase Ste14